MVQIITQYDIPENSFDNVRQAIAQHLTPKNEDDLSFVGMCYLPEMRQGILAPMKEDEWLFTVKYAFEWTHAAEVAQDLGLFPRGTEEETRQLQRDRYDLQIAPGERTCYRLEIYPSPPVIDQSYYSCKNPLTICLQGDSGAGDGIGLAMLYRLRNELREASQDVAVRSLAETTVRMKKDYSAPEHILRELESITPTLENVERQIEQRMEKGQRRDFRSTIRALRYFEDFIGQGIRAAGYKPVVVKTPFIGEGVYLSPNEMEQITTFPHQTDDWIIENIFLPRRLESEELKH